MKSTSCAINCGATMSSSSPRKLPLLDPIPFVLIMSTGGRRAPSPRATLSLPSGRKRLAIRIFRLTRTLAVVGAGVIGCEYASIFAALGVRVTLIDKRDRLLPFVDAEIADTLCHHLRENRATLRLNESVKRLDIIEGNGHGTGVKLSLDSGKTIIADKALYSVGRTGATSRLNLATAGLLPDSRGRLVVNEHYQSEIPGIYAVGDV